MAINDFNLGLIGKLDGTKSKHQLNNDIVAIQKTINELQLKAKLDPNQVKALQSQIDSLKVSLNDVTISQSALNNMVTQINNALKGIQIPNISVGGTQPQQYGQQYGQQFQQGFNSAIQKGQFQQEFFFSADKQNKVAKDAQKYFSGISNGIVSVQERMQEFEGKSTLSGFVVNIKNAKGEVESLRYSLRNIIDDTTGAVTGQMFKYTGGSINDKEAIKQIQAIENAFTDYTQKLAQFKSTNTNILSGLTAPLQDFETKLAGLKNGTSTIDEVKNSFKLLGTEASKVTANFTGQLSKTDAAIRKLSQGDEIMDGLKASFKGLSNAPKDINTELNKVSKLLREVRNIESQEGRTANWSAKYREWSDEVDKLKAKLSVLQKQQASMTTPQIFKTSDLRSADIPYMTKVSNTIEKQMAEIQKMANAKGWQNFEVKGIEKADGQIKSLTLTVREADGALKQFQMQRAKLQESGKAQTGLMQVGDVKVLETASQAQAKLAQQTENANAKLQEQVNKIQLSTGTNGTTTAQIEVLRNSFTKLGLSADEVKNKMNGVDTELKELQTLMSSGADNSAIVAQYERLQTVLSQTQNNLKTTRSEYSLLATEQQRLALANTIEAWNQKNTAATKAVREENDRYVLSLRDLNTQMTKMQLGQINTAFKQTENSMRALNKLGASFTNQMKQAVASFSTWLSASTLVMKTISETREAVTNIKEVDNILTEISKTSDMTAESLERLGIASYDVASKYGRTAKDYLSAFESMARSGFYGEIGEGMSEMSLLAQAAGDINQEIADSYIIATNAAYKFNGDIQKLNAVLDGQNLITNRNSVALKDMATAMSEAGSTASAYRVNIEELSAMIGTMEAVTKSGGNEVGNSIKSILINLQNVTSSKITGTLSKANASMTEFVNGSEKLRNPIEILRDLAKTFNELDEDDPLRAEILTNVGGKYQANKLSALLQNMELFDKMLVDYSEGSGSALEEASKSANNLTGRLNALQNSWYELINSVIQSDDLKFIVNLLDGITQSVTNLIKPLGTLGTIGLGAGLFAGIKNVGKRRSTMFHNCFEYADRDKCFLYEIGFLSPIVKYTLVNEATISVEII